MFFGGFIKRDDFIEQWVMVEEEIDVDFKSIRLKEKDQSRESAINPLKETIIDHYAKSKKRDKYLNDRKFDKLEKYISKRIPFSDRTRKGDFGEILGCECMIQTYGFEFPVPRLRYNPNLETSMIGEDILGFKIINNKIVEICVGESKLSEKFNNRTINDAHC
ncbi:MAG: Hachiman antiphage defense system protein HamA, partial [Methanobacteriaceae archaeon]